MSMTPHGDPIGEPVPGWTPRPLPARALWEANALDMTGRNFTYLPVEPFTMFADYAAWVEQAAVMTDFIFYAALIPEGARFRAVGTASYLRIAPEAGSIEVGYINFSPLLQKSRAATEAMYLMMRHAFERWLDPSNFDSQGRQRAASPAASC